jgi:hypothetical protein
MNTLSSFGLFGLQKTWQPFGQALAGVAHSSGSLVRGRYSPARPSGFCSRLSEAELAEQATPYPLERSRLAIEHLRRLELLALPLANEIRQ